MIVAFIAENKDRFGVEPICRVLTEHDVPIAPSTFYAALKREASARALRDEVVLAAIERVYTDQQVGRRLSGAQDLPPAAPRRRR